MYPPCAPAQTFVIMTRLAFDINREAAVGVRLGHEVPLASLITVILKACVVRFCFFLFCFVLRRRLAFVKLCCRPHYVRVEDGWWALKVQNESVPKYKHQKKKKKEIKFNDAIVALGGVRDWGGGGIMHCMMILRLMFPVVFLRLPLS